MTIALYSELRTNNEQAVEMTEEAAEVIAFYFNIKFSNLSRRWWWYDTFSLLQVQT